jgi:hypothetical protein
LYTKLCGLQEEARSFGEGKYFLPVLGIEQWFVDCPSHGLVPTVIRI